MADNPVVISTVCSITALYLLLLVWARRKDKHDLLKVSDPEISTSRLLQVVSAIVKKRNVGGKRYEARSGRSSPDSLAF